GGPGRVRARARARPQAGVVAARPRPRGRRGRRPSHGSPRLPRAAGDLAWVRPESPRTRGGDPVSRGEALRSGLRPDGDDAAAGVAPEELARRFRRAAVNLDALNVLGRRVAREVGRRLVAVEKILRVAARRRPDHLCDTRVRDAHLLHASHRDQDIDEGGRPGALDLLLGEEIAHPRVPATLDVREPLTPSPLARATTWPWSTPGCACWAGATVGAAIPAATTVRHAAGPVWGRGVMCRAVSCYRYSIVLKPTRKEPQPGGWLVRV